MTAGWSVKFFPRRRKFGLWAGLLLLVGAVWLGVYAWNSGFTGKWRGMIARELAKHGLRAEIGRLTLDPVEGLSARDVKLYDMAHRDQLLATIDSISLDIDVARLMNHEPFLRTINLQQADVALPVDPADPQSEWLTVKGLTARLVFQRDHIEIARAEGLVSGILVRASGSVGKPPPKPKSKEEMERLRAARTRQLEEMRDRRGVLRSVLRVLDRFQTEVTSDGTIPVNKAELDLEVRGDLSEPGKLELRASLKGGPLKYTGGSVKNFHAEADLSGGLLTLKSLEVHDSKGVLHAAASWKIGRAEAVGLAVESTIDWQPLLRAAMDEAPWLGEVVFYSPPEFQWEGKWFPALSTSGEWPLEGQGHFKTRRFLSRGVVFDGLETSFAVRRDGTVYLRDALLTHHTGTVRGQLLNGPEGGRYDVEWQMSVNAAAPFIAESLARSIVERFNFRNQSRVEVRMSGQKEKNGGWKHTGHLEMHDFAYQQTPLQEISANISVDSASPVSLIFRNVLVRMDDSTGTAQELGFDIEKHLLHITDGASTLMPARFVNLFLPSLAQELTQYRFEKAPESTIAGVIDLKTLDRSDYRINVRARSRCGLDIAGQPYEFDGVRGNIHILGPLLRLDLAGDSVPHTTAFGSLRLDDSAPATFDGTFSLIKEHRPPPVWNVTVKAPGRVSVLVMRRTWPLDQFAGRLKCADNKISVTGGGQLFGGKFGASLDFPESSKPGHHASVILDHVSFARLTEIIDATRKSEGWVTGNFSYKMESSRPETIQGTGEVKLENGNIFALPLLGPLSGLLKAVLPGENPGYSIARSATATLHVADGKINVPDFEASTGTFRLTASGDVDYVRDRVDFLARVNLRGPPGLLLFPVSKLFEYHASGTPSDPGWHARFLSNPFRRNSTSEAGGKPPTEPAPRRPAASQHDP